MKKKVNIEKLYIKNYRNCYFSDFEIINKENLEKIIGPRHFYCALKSAFHEEGGSLICQTERGGGHNGDLVMDMNPPHISHFDVENVIKGKSLYIGHFFAHYGHFITEGISRLWGDNISDYDNYIIAPFLDGCDGIVFQEFHHAIYNSLGVDVNKIHIMEEKTRVESMDVPDKALTINKNCNIFYRKILKKIVSFYAEDTLQKKIYVSRVSDDRIGNTKEVEEFFFNNGFEVIHPGNINFKDQLNIFYNSSIIIGLPGAALHNNAFAKDNHILVELGDQRSWNSPISTQLITNQISNANDFFVPFDKENVGIDIDFLADKINEINIFKVDNQKPSSNQFFNSYVLPADYAFHVAWEGDKYISQDELHEVNWKNPIEGFSIKTSDKSLLKIKYKAICNNKISENWAKNGDFVGTKRESQKLNGYILEVYEGQELFEVKCIGYFSNGKSITVNSGELCISTDSFLTGIMILVHESKIFRKEISF